MDGPFLVDFDDSTLMGQQFHLCHVMFIFEGVPRSRSHPTVRETNCSVGALKERNTGSFQHPVNV